MVDSPSTFGAGHGPPDSKGPSLFDESVLYLLAFSESFFDLVPDGLAVVDERLRVRSANAAFAAFVQETSAAGARGKWIEQESWANAHAESHGASFRVADLLRDQFTTGHPLTLEGLTLPQTSGDGKFSIRSTPWDSSNPNSKRLLLWIRREAAEAAEAEAPTSLLEEKNDRYFVLRAFIDRLLDVAPVGVSLLDPSLRVIIDSAWMREHLGHGAGASPADRHMFSVYPILRETDVHRTLKECRRSQERQQLQVDLTSADGGSRTIVFDAIPFLPEDSVRGVLLLAREVITPSAAVAPTDAFATEVMERPEFAMASAPANDGPANFASSANEVPANAVAAGIETVGAASSPTSALESPAEDDSSTPASNFEDVPASWARAADVPILLVEPRLGPRTDLSDTLRVHGFDDVTALASPTDALVRQDPTRYGLVVLGFEPWDQEVVEFARRVAQEAPRVPLVIVSSADPRDVTRFFAEIPIRRVLSREEGKHGLALLAGEFLGIQTPNSGDVASPAVARRVILLGARESDIPVLRLLYRASGIDLRMVYDPDPSASGLVLARSLGLPALAGPLEMQMEPLPDAVVLAREGLQEAAARLGLEGIAQITRDEIELFLVDPESFMESETGRDVIPVQGIPESSPVAFDPPVTTNTVVMTRPDFANMVPSPPATPSNAPDSLSESREEWNGPASTETQQLEFHTHAPAHAAASPSTEEAAATHSEHEIERLLAALDLLLEFQKLADWSLETAIRITSGASGSLMIQLEDRPVLSIVASSGLKDFAQRHRRQRIGEGIAGRVAEEGEPMLLVGKVGSDTGLRPMGARPEIRSSVSVPVFADGRVIGVLNLNSDPTREPFTSETMERAAEFGRQVGVALSRSLHLRKMRGRSFEQSMRAEIGMIAATPGDVVGKLRLCADRLAKVLAADSSAIYLLDSTREFVELAATSTGRNTTLDVGRIPVGAGVIGWVAKSRRSLVLRNPDEEVGDPQPTNIAIPIRHQTDLVGVLTLESSQPIATDEDRLAFVESIAASIGDLIAETKSAESSSKMVTMLSALSELGLAFGAASNPQGLGRLVAFTGATVLESDVALVRLRLEGPAVHLGHGDVNDFEALAAHGASIPHPTEPLGQLEARLAERALQSGEPCRDQDLPLAEVETLLRQSNVAAAIAIPITSEKLLVGSVFICRVASAMGAVTSFGISELEIGSRLGDYAAAAARKFLPLGMIGADSDAEEGYDS